MAIVFRCPECDHKLRASEASAGKQSKCKCGSLVMVPRLGRPPRPEDNDDDEPIRKAWRLEPKFGPAGDLCEAITAWSPLCAPAVRPARNSSVLPSYWQGMLVGSAGILAVCLLVVGLIAVFRPSQQDPAGEKPPASPPPTAAAAPSSDPRPSQASPVVKKEQPKQADKEKDKRNTPAKGKEAVKAVQAASDKQPEKKIETKPVEKEQETVEIIEWYTAKFFSVVGDQGKTEKISLDEAKSGLILVAVKVRFPPRFLDGKVFDVEDADAKLIAPSQKDACFALGCGIPDNKWFAPSRGQHRYPPAKGNCAEQAWFFFAPVDDLQSGRTSFQYRTEAPLNLRLGDRKK